MAPRDLTVKILEEIREDIRGVRGDLAQSRREFKEAREESNQRFEAIERTLRDLAEQMVMLARRATARLLR